LRKQCILRGHTKTCKGQYDSDYDNNSFIHTRLYL
jgi:hypothetical protein